MRKELRERRERTWNLLVVKGLDYSDVVDRIARSYGVTESAIENDIAKMDDWLPELDDMSHASGVSRLRELRQARQRLQQLAMETRGSDDLDKEQQLRQERKILNDIQQLIETDVELSQSLGLADREPEEIEHTVEGGEAYSEWLAQGDTDGE